MSNELTATATKLQCVTLLGRVALFGGYCFDLALTRKSRRFFWHLYVRSGVSLNAS